MEIYIYIYIGLFLISYVYNDLGAGDFEID